ncbi:MAG: hypothetical protein OXC69_04345 [Candidatus Tectomicrobia bacterium]|nr:hypothetical protein [Candidatus Tectomicrobia bacterium]
MMRNSLTEAFEILRDELLEELDDASDGARPVLQAVETIIGALEKLLEDLPHQQPSPPRSDFGSWKRSGVVLPEGTKLRITYGPFSVEEHGEVKRRKLCFQGQYFDAPSPAVSAAFRRKTGRDRNFNGWIHVEAYLNNRWQSLNNLRNPAA